MASELTIEVRIDAIEEPRSGVSKSGNGYFVQAFVSTIIGPGTRQLRFEVIGADRVRSMALQVGKCYKLHLDVTSRCYTGREGQTLWTNDVRAYMANVIE